RRLRSGAERGVVEHAVADATGGDGGLVGDEGRRREVFDVGENEAVRAVVGRRAEEPRHPHPRGHGAHDGGVGGAGRGEVDVVHDEAGLRRARQEFAGQRGGVRRGRCQRGGQRGGDGPAVLDLLKGDLVEILRAGEGGQAVERALPRGRHGAAGEDEAEGGVEPEIDAAHYALDVGDRGAGAARQQVGERDVDAVAGRAVHRPGGAGESVVAGG